MEKEKPDVTLILLKEIRAVNKKLLGAVLPPKTFVELDTLGYVEGNSFSAKLTSNGIKALSEEVESKKKSKQKGRSK